MNTINSNGLRGHGFSKVTAVIIALENYRTPPEGEPLPNIDFAEADASAFADVISQLYGDLTDGAIKLRIIKGAEASVTALRGDLTHSIKQLDNDELFIFYYVGHGFYGYGGNRLSAYDTNRHAINDTTLSVYDDLMEPLAASACSQALFFLDAHCDAETHFDLGQIAQSFGAGRYIGVFASCCDGEASYSSVPLKRGVWSHLLTEAMMGRASDALSEDRCLNDTGLSEYLARETPSFITRQMKVRGTQTPRAQVSPNGDFQIGHYPAPITAAADAVLAGIKLRNNSEFLEGIETGQIKRLAGFTRGKHSIPKEATEFADAMCQSMLADGITEEIQELYMVSRKALNARRKDVQKGDDNGAGDLDTAAFRYSIESGQNPDDPSEYIVRRRLELRHDWEQHRAAITKIFDNKFDRLVVEFESMDDTFDDLVDKLEDIQEAHGGEVTDDDRTMRATYARNGVTFTYDLAKRRLEVSNGDCETLGLIDTAQKFQLGNRRKSAMLGAGADQEDD